MSKTIKILLKRSTVAGKAPTADIMEQGEAFVNLAKGTEHLYFKNAENEVIATKLGPLDKELDETSEYGVENQAIAKKYNELNQAIATKYNELKKQLDLIASTSSIYGFARVNGDNSPAGTIFFGERVNLKEITSHFHMGLTTKDGKLYKKCANCRLDIANDGTELKIDGTDGDVMLVTDSKLYFLKGTVSAPSDLNLGDGVKLNIIAFGMTPFNIYGVKAKAFDPFAFNPQYTVNCKIEGVDNVVCAHSIYNTAYEGTYQAAEPLFHETFKSNGKGYCTQGVSSSSSIWHAQGKNAVQKTNRPYMGGYYEFFEIFIALMFCELKSVYHQDLGLFGTGCTLSNFAHSFTSFGDATMKGNSGVMRVRNDGKTTYTTFLNGPEIKYDKGGTTATTNHIINGLCGDMFGFTEMLEPVRILNDIAKAGLISKIWNAEDYNHPNRNVVFEYGANGNMKVSNFTNEELATGANMVPNHKYYQVRNVPKIAGMAEGVMTAVINIYVKMLFKENVIVAGDDMSGGYVVYKFSHPVYRGLCLMDGLSYQLQGCHYVNCCIKNTEDKYSHYVTYFKCAENVDDIPAQQSPTPTPQGNINTTLDWERGLTKVVEADITAATTSLAWMQKADYNASLLCYTTSGGSIETGECAALLFDTKETAQPNVGQKNVLACNIGGGLLNKDASSVRTVTSNGSTTSLFANATGHFSIPHLQL